LPTSPVDLSEIMRPGLRVLRGVRRAFVPLTYEEPPSSAMWPDQRSGNVLADNNPRNPSSPRRAVHLGERVVPLSTGIPILPGQNARIKGVIQNALGMSPQRLQISNQGTVGGMGDWFINQLWVTDGNRREMIIEGVAGDRASKMTLESSFAIHAVELVVTYDGDNRDGAPFYASLLCSEWSGCRFVYIALDDRLHRLDLVDGFLRQHHDLGHISERTTAAILSEMELDEQRVVEVRDVPLGSLSIPRSAIYAIDERTGLVVLVMRRTDTDELIVDWTPDGSSPTWLTQPTNGSP